MRKIICFLLICIASKAWSNKIADAYEALSVFDYFKAKQLFYKSLPKYPAESSFGLATIYHRNDNPFTNIDSAAKYIGISHATFKDTVTYSSFSINKQSIENLMHSVCENGLKKYVTNQNADSIKHYLNHFYFAEERILDLVFYARDGLAIKYYLSFKSSDSARYFLKRYPESFLTGVAIAEGYNFEYTEKVDLSNAQQLKQFIKHYSQNPNVSHAENTLFELTKQLHNADSLYNYIKNYSTVNTKEEAWKLLYSISVKSYNKEELTTFLNKYPDYPYNETLLKEISLSQTILLPLKHTNDKFGFIDTLGNWIIKPQFDDAMDFSEGFAAVCKNDSCFYIDKEGLKTSDYYFEETESYKNGVAIVKKDNTYYLINRSGQMISKGYQDINESSENIYVCKLNNLYGAIDAKANVIIPFSYTKLGDFKNGYAYYLSSKYGLVDINNKALNAQWDWISDVDENNIAIVKKENKFGLISVNESIILNTSYDYIAPAKNSIYILVKNNFYGFYNATEKCFVTYLEYDYDPAFMPDYYTNGKNFKLIKEGEVALIDANGRYSINFNTYSNLFFAKCDVIRIQKNNKFGYVDRKLKPVTTVEFEEAFDFKNDAALAAKKGTYQLINTQGKIIYSVKSGFIYDDLSGNYYKTSFNELFGLINNSGEVLLNIEFTSIDQINAHLFYCKKNEGTFLFNSATKTLKKL